MNTHGRVVSIILMVTGLFILILAGFGWYAYRTYLAAPPVVAGVVMVEAGDVMVNTKAISDPGDVGEGDVVQTNSGQATIVLYGAVKIRLQENTEIVLRDMTKEHPRVEQTRGETWNEFIPANGVEMYTISEGDAAATAIGTVFMLSNGRVVTAEGSVAYTNGDTVFTVSAGQVVETLDGRPTQREATEFEKEQILTHLQYALNELRADRENLLQRNQAFIDQLKEQFSITDEQITEMLAQLDAGERDLDDMLSRAPIIPGVVQRAADITRAIRQINSEIAQIQ